MHLTNMHTHTVYCDGKATTEEMVIAAINCNMQSIGISTHGPTPFVSDWNISLDKVESYIWEINRLKEKYEGVIEIYLGMELDYIPGAGFDSNSIALMDRLDYYIGSVHYLGYFKDGTMWTVDYDKDGLIRGINEGFGGDSRLAVETYYSLISDMAKRYEPPIIGHLDLFKKNNGSGIFFDEQSEWYHSAVLNALDVIAHAGSIVEINTGGIARGFRQDQYPSTWILEEIRDRGIPVIIDSDAHTPDSIACKFDEMYNLVSELGFNKLSYMTKDGWRQQPIMEV